MYTKVVSIRNPSGLHARPASEFVAAAKGFQSRITLRRKDDDSAEGNAKSIIILLSLGLCRGEAVELSAEGPDEEQAVETLAALIDSGFGEL